MKLLLVMTLSLPVGSWVNPFTLPGPPCPHPLMERTFQLQFSMAARSVLEIVWLRWNAIEKKGNYSLSNILGIL